MLESLLSRILDLDTQGSLKAVVQSGTAWEQLSFGIEHIDPLQPSFFTSKEIRQAVAMCIDRQAIVDATFAGQISIPDTYVSASHPLRNLDLAPLTWDPQTAAVLLQNAGWIDHDSDPTTPRISAGVVGMPDGQPFEVLYLVPDDAERRGVAAQIADALLQCGIQTQIENQDWSALLGPGPQAPVFGRQFDLAQFAWVYSVDPACDLFTSAALPGPYPQYSQGWGGANATGYQSAVYDQYCAQAQTTLPDEEPYLSAQQQAQAIFRDELPALPLYQRPKVVAMRPDMCGLLVDPAFGSVLSAIETIDYGINCK
jgi:ABC-type transport system substrate-binding protein